MSVLLPVSARMLADLKDADWTGPVARGMRGDLADHTVMDGGLIWAKYDWDDAVLPLCLNLQLRECEAVTVSMIGERRGHKRAAMWHRSRSFWNDGVRAWGYMYPRPSRDFPPSEVLHTAVWCSALDWSKSWEVIPELADLDLADPLVDLHALRIIAERVLV